MPTKRGNIRGRLQALRNRHALLSEQLENEMKHPAANPVALKKAEDREIAYRRKKLKWRRHNTPDGYCVIVVKENAALNMPRFRISKGGDD